MNGKQEQTVDPAKHAHTLESEIDAIRNRLDKGLAELDRRRHEYMDWRLQLRRHPEIVWAAAGVGVLLVGGIGFAIWRSSKRNEPVEKAKRFRIAVGRAVDNPKRVAKGQPSVGEKILASVGTTIAVSLTKRLLEKAWSQPRPA